MCQIVSSRHVGTVLQTSKRISNDNNNAIIIMWLTTTCVYDDGVRTYIFNQLVHTTVDERISNGPMSNLITIRCLTGK